MHLRSLVTTAFVLAGLIPLSGARGQSTEVPLEARVDSFIREYRSHYGPASISVAISRGGTPLLIKTWGAADIESGRAARPADAYRIGSIAKQFTASLILRLVDRGDVALDDPIGRHLPSLRPPWRSITIEQLLNHTGGLTREFRNPDDPTAVLTTQQLLELAAADTATPRPGVAFSYSNTGYMLLGALVEKLYGTSYAHALRDEITGPLGLDQLGWCTELETEDPGVVGYERVGPGELRPATYLHTSQSLGSGGICASAAHLVAWNAALHGGRVLADSSYQALVTPAGAAADEGYAFGLRVGSSPWGTPIIFHTGGTPGFAAENAWFPDESLSVAVLHNAPQPKTAVALDLARLALGMALPDRPAASARPVRISEVAGVVGLYEMAPGQAIAIRFQDGRLVGQMGSGPVHLMTSRQGGDFTVESLNAVVRFRFEGGTTATAMLLEQGGGERVLSRVATAQPSASEAAEISGAYQLGPGQTITITLEEGQFVGRQSGGATHEMIPQPGGGYLVPSINAVVTFERDASKRATAMIVRQGGSEKRLPRAP